MSDQRRAALDAALHEMYVDGTLEPAPTVLLSEIADRIVAAMTTPFAVAQAAERVAATGSELESAWLVPKIDREQQLGGPMARHRASLVALRAALATPSEPTLDATPHEHYWVDAFDDETAWHCTICGVTEYPEDRPAIERLLDDHQPKVDYGYETVACSCGWEPHQGGASIEDPDEWWWDDHIRPLFLDTRLGRRRIRPPLGDTPMTTPDLHTHDQFLVKCSCGWSLASQSDGPDQRRYGPEPTPSQPEPLDHTHDPGACVGCANSMAMAFESGFRAGIMEAKNRLSRAGMHDGKCPEPKEPCTCGLDAAIDGEGFTP